MMGVAKAIKSQKKIMPAPIVALLDWMSLESILPSQAMGDDAHRNQPPLFRRSSVGDIGGIPGDNEFDPSLMVMVAVLSPITQIECAGS